MSEPHMKAVARYVTLPATVLGDVGELLSEKHMQEKFKNRKMLLVVLSNIRYLARQALSLRRNWVPIQGRKKTQFLPVAQTTSSR